MFSWAAGCWTKIITLFVFAKIEIHFSQNTGIRASAAYNKAGAMSRQRILQPSSNSYVQDFLIYFTNTA